MVNLTFYVCRDTSESEEEEDQLEKENSAAGICQTLTDIASGYTVATITGDFFGDSELAGLGVEGLVSLEGGVGVLSRRLVRQVSFPLRVGRRRNIGDVERCREKWRRVGAGDGRHDVVP